MDAASLTAFIAAAALLTIAPGPDSTLILRTAAVEGRPVAVAAGVGILLGCLVWAVAAALGLGALLAASETAYTVLKWIGAAYLCWLGVRLLLSPRRELPANLAPSLSAGSGWFVRGLLTNLLNPKVGVFYASFLPQFIPADAAVVVWSLAMGVTHIGLTVIWFALLILATKPIAAVLRRPAVMQWLDRVTGGVFVAFGLRLALESRR